MGLATCKVDPAHMPQSEQLGGSLKASPETWWLACLRTVANMFLLGKEKNWSRMKKLCLEIGCVVEEFSWLVEPEENTSLSLLLPCRKLFSSLSQL